MPPRRRGGGLRPVGVLLAAGVMCATIGLAVVLLEDSMIYYPTRYPDGFWDTTALSQGTGGHIEDHYFEARDGVRLHGWWARPDDETSGTGGMVLLFFHGNAGNLSHRAELVVRLMRLPVQVFIIDYRGYGRSDGRPSEAGLYLDAEAAWRYLKDRGVGAGRIVVFGRSLGGAVAVELATKAEPAGLILESTFTSMPDMASHHFPIVPKVLLRTRMDSLSKIRRVAAPKLHIHSPSDEVVPYELGRRLYDAAPPPKRFCEIPGAGHNDTYLVGGGAYLAEIRSFVAGCQVGGG